MELKITFVEGLLPIVLQELKQYESVHIIETQSDAVYCEYVPNFAALHTLRSAIALYSVQRSILYNPGYVSRHKSLLGDLVQAVLSKQSKKALNYKINCAGSDSAEVLELHSYIQNTFGLLTSSEPDMEIIIAKHGAVWEIATRTTPRPLSVRSYRTQHIPGGLNPCIAYAMNSLCDLDSAHTYMNVFSGSGTLLIEAGLMNRNVELLGFDYDSTHISAAVRNAHMAGLQRRVQISKADIFEHPPQRMYDMIASDLPFGMSVSKGADLHALYMRFVEYCEQNLSPQGRLVVDTSEHELLRSILNQSRLKIENTLPLKLSTNTGAYLYPQIFVCELEHST